VNASSAAAAFDRCCWIAQPGAVHAGARRPFKFFLVRGSRARRRAALDPAAGQPGDSIPAGCRGDDRNARRRAARRYDRRAGVICIGRATDRGSFGLERLAALQCRYLVLVHRSRRSPRRGGPLRLLTVGASRSTSSTISASSARAGRFPAALIEWLQGYRRSPSAAVCRRCAKRSAPSSTRDVRAPTRSRLPARARDRPHVPILGVVLGAFASGADMFAITGIQMTLFASTLVRRTAATPICPRCGTAAYRSAAASAGRARRANVSGFIPVGGIFIKAAIAYAGTVVVGEGGTFYYRKRPADAARATRRASTTNAKSSD